MIPKDYWISQYSTLRRTLMKTGRNLTGSLTQEPGFRAHLELVQIVSALIRNPLSQIIWGRVGVVSTALQSRYDLTGLARHLV